MKGTEEEKKETVAMENYVRLVYELFSKSFFSYLDKYLHPFQRVRPEER
jgi:hypothetical protein